MLIDDGSCCSHLHTINVSDDVWVSECLQSQVGRLCKLDLGSQGQEVITTYRQCLQLVLDVGVSVIPWLTSSSLLSVKSNINTVTASPVD